MPNRRFRISILCHGRVALGWALLLRDIFGRANALGPGEGPFEVSLVGFRTLRDEALTLKPRPPGEEADVVVVPPLEAGFDGDLSACRRDVAWLETWLCRDRTLATSCLGAFLAAEAGLLRDREATTHWRWMDEARRRYPDVRWKPRDMLCDAGPVVTAGGYMATLDLTLHLIRRLAGEAVASELGRRLLVDTVRQKQSLYASKLTAAPAQEALFPGLDRWIEDSLGEPLTAEAFMRRYPMSTRSLYRKFVACFGVSPRKYVQLKRIEKARLLLRDSDLGLDQIMSRIGLSDPVSFRRVFERELGLSPSRYRQAVRRGD